jgi:hypothetical protein
MLPNTVGVPKPANDEYIFRVTKYEKVKDGCGKTIYVKHVLSLDRC